MRIAYFTNQYPAVSHTFIRREIRALEASGLTILRYSLRSKAAFVDPEDKREASKTSYILSAGVSEFARCLFITLFTQPIDTFQNLLLAVKIGWRSDRGVLRHLAYLAEATVLARWCRRDAAEHIHAHFGTNSAAIAMLASQFSGIPYSFTAHGPEEFDQWPNTGLTEKILRSAFVVAISSFGRSQLYRRVDQKHWHKVQVVHCGLAQSDFAAMDAPPSTARRFVCVGRICEQKGQMLLVEAVQLLAERGEDFELVLAGDGEMRSDVKALIKHYGVEATVRITGWIDNKQVREEILAARALVLPSFAEGLPVVIMEAMALKRPVVSTFVAGIPELVLPGKHGWLVPAGDVEALADAMADCLDTPLESLVRMGEAAEQRVFERHNVNTEAAKLVKLFTAAIKRYPIIAVDDKKLTLDI